MGTREHICAWVRYQSKQGGTDLCPAQDRTAAVDVGLRNACAESGAGVGAKVIAWKGPIINVG